VIVGTITPAGQLMAEGPRKAEVEKWSGDLKTIDKSLQASCATCAENSSSFDSNEICNDLYRFACIPGEFNDGTGSASTSVTTESIVAPLRVTATSFSLKELDSALNNSNDAEFRKLAMATVGRGNSSECRDSKPSKDCDALLAQGLNKYLMKLVSIDIASADVPFMDPNNLSAEERSRIEPRFDDGGSLEDFGRLMQSPSFQKVYKDVTSFFRSQLQDQKAAEKVQNKIFPEVKTLLAKAIAAHVSDPKIRETLVAKTNAIQFKGADCSELPTWVNDMGHSESAFISSLLIPNAYYDEEKNTFHYCNGMLLRSQSEFQIVALMAHELDHSLDPCNIAKGPSEFQFKYSSPQNVTKSQEEFPFKNIISCLRSEKSVAAIGHTAGTTTSEQIREINASLPKMESVYCDKDQIGESFADWLSAEVLSEYMAKQHPDFSRNQMRIGYTNVWRSFCNLEKHTNVYDAHPSDDKRANKLMLVNPKIRQQMGCPAKLEPNSTYCSVKGNGAL
jgi:hypothetical protein